MSTKRGLGALRGRILSMARFAELKERYGADAGKPASQRETDPYPSKYRPPAKFARDRWGISSVHTGPNRHERRAEAAWYRKDQYRLAEKSNRRELIHKGSRSRRKAELRAIVGPEGRFGIRG